MAFLFHLVAVATVSTITRGWALSLLWWWFVAVPFGTEGLGKLHAVGLAALLSLAINPAQQKVESAADAYAQAIVVPALTALIGKVIFLLMQV